MNFRNPEIHDESGLDMTPMIDMVFQLLIFFLITTTFAVNVKQGGIEVDMPKASSSQIPAMASQAVIAILKDGRMLLGGNVASEESLKEQLSEIYKKNPQTMVVVQADKMTNHWQVVRAMDLAASIGIKKLAIATVKE